MRQFSDRFGSWALVAGAAEGLGQAFSETLAALGMNLVMVDHNEVLLEKVSADLTERYRVQTRPVLADLADPDAWKSCLDAATGVDCRLLVYVAAYSRVMLFRNHTPETLERTLAVNTRTVIRLTYEFSARLRGQGRPGGILLMGSLSGLEPPPLVGPYAATKAFNIKLAEALFPELKRYGIGITTCVAGVIDTPAYRASRPSYGWFRPQVMKPADVARYAVVRIGTQPVVIPGLGNRISHFILKRLLPDRLALFLVGSTMRRMYREEWLKA